MTIQLPQVHSAMDSSQLSDVERLALTSIRAQVRKDLILRTIARKPLLALKNFVEVTIGELSLYFCRCPGVNRCIAVEEMR
jgi:hypothetical protein